MRHDLFKLAAVEVKRMIEEAPNRNPLYNPVKLMREIFRRAYRIGYDDGRNPFKDDADPSKGRWDSAPRYYGRLRDDMRQRAVPPTFPITISWWFDENDKPHPYVTIKKEKPMALRIKKSSFIEFVLDFLHHGNKDEREKVLCSVLAIQNHKSSATIITAASDAWERRCESVVLFAIGAYHGKLPVIGDEFYGSSVDMNEDEFIVRDETPQAKTLEPLTLEKVADRTIAAYEKHRVTCKAAQADLDATIVTLFEEAKDQGLNEIIVRGVFEAGQKQVMGQILDEILSRKK